MRYSKTECLDRESPDARCHARCNAHCHARCNTRCVVQQHKSEAISTKARLSSHSEKSRLNPLYKIGCCSPQQNRLSWSWKIACCYVRCTAHVTFNSTEARLTAQKRGSAPQQNRLSWSWQNACCEVRCNARCVVQQHKSEAISTKARLISDSEKSRF